MAELMRDLRVVRALALNDIRVSLTERLFTVISVVIPINFLLLFILFALSGGQAPTAVVMADQGPYAQQFLGALQNAHSFAIAQTSDEQAQELMRQGRIVAIITVPANFDDALRAGQHVGLPVVVNNLNVDFTNDIRRAVPLAITSFYADAFPDQVSVRAQEVDRYARDTDYVQYLGVSIVVVSLLLSGLLQAGSNAAREYETGTVKELLLSPASRWSIEVGKVLGALALNVLAAAPVLAVVILVLGIVPVHWGELLGDTLLLMLTFIALGTLVGTLVRRRLVVIPLSLAVALPVFFISGPFQPIEWGDPVTSALARLQPAYYGIAVFQHAFHDFDTTATSVPVNTLLLMVFAVAAVALSALVLRRRGLGT